jgi:hypothetical protein
MVPGFGVLTAVLNDGSPMGSYAINRRWAGGRWNDNRGRYAEGTPSVGGRHTRISTGCADKPTRASGSRALAQKADAANLERAHRLNVFQLQVNHSAVVVQVSTDDGRTKMKGLH